MRWEGAIIEYDVSARTITGVRSQYNSDNDFTVGNRHNDSLGISVRDSIICGIIPVMILDSLRERDEVICVTVSLQERPGTVNEPHDMSNISVAKVSAERAITRSKIDCYCCSRLFHLIMVIFQVL